MDNTGVFLIAGAGALFLLSRNSEASLGGGGGTGSPVTNAEENTGAFDLSQLGGLLNGFTNAPSNNPSSTGIIAGTTKKQASSMTSYDEGNGQTVNALNFSSQTLGESAYASPSGQIFAPNFSSQTLGGSAYVSPPVSKKTASASSSLNFTPAQNSTPANANFSPMTGGAIYIPPPNPVATSSNNNKNSNVGSSKKNASASVTTQNGSVVKMKTKAVSGTSTLRW